MRPGPPAVDIHEEAEAVRRARRPAGREARRHRDHRREGRADACAARAISSSRTTTATTRASSACSGKFVRTFTLPENVADRRDQGAVQGRRARADDPQGREGRAAPDRSAGGVNGTPPALPTSAPASTRRPALSVVALAPDMHHPAPFIRRVIERCRISLSACVACRWSRARLCPRWRRSRRLKLLPRMPTRQGDTAERRGGARQGSASPAHRPPARGARTSAQLRQRHPLVEPAGGHRAAHRVCGSAISTRRRPPPRSASSQRRCPPAALELLDEIRLADDFLIPFDKRQIGWDGGNYYLSRARHSPAAQDALDAAGRRPPPRLQLHVQRPRAGRHAAVLRQRAHPLRRSRARTHDPLDRAEHARCHSWPQAIADASAGETLRHVHGCREGRGRAAGTRARSRRAASTRVIRTTYPDRRQRPRRAATAR